MNIIKTKQLLVASLITGSLASFSAYAEQTKTLPASETATLKLCVDYPTMANKAQQDEALAELDKRIQLSEKDHENLHKKQIETGNTMCGMYMILGKPLQEKSKQLRPMVFKSIHVYEDNYYVTQMGVVVEKLERKEGQLPPSLSTEKPKVVGPPVLFIAPSGRPH